jgi:hypothetical protein
MVWKSQSGILQVEVTQGSGSEARALGDYESQAE